MQTSKISDSIRKYFAAYESKDRQVVEDLLADDFTFTSPRDPEINREAYFERCWPNCWKFKTVHIEDLMEKDNEAFVLYEIEPTLGEKIRNTERIKFSGDKIQAVEVYFGSLPRSSRGEDEENE